MKQFSKKNRICGMIAAGAFAAALVGLSACKNFTIPTPPKGQTNTSTAKMTELVIEWKNDGNDFADFDGYFKPVLKNGGKNEAFFLSGLDETLQTITLYVKTSEPKELISYDTTDMVLHANSPRTTARPNRISHEAIIVLDMRYRFDTNIYLYVGRHIYTIFVQKTVLNRRIYVSGDGDGSGNDSVGGSLRGYTPDTAFYSLKNAVEKGKMIESYDIFIIGDLASDPEVSSAEDATFFIETGRKRFRFWGYDGGKLKGASGKRVVDVSNSDAMFINLEISGGEAANGGGVFVDGSKAAFFNCNITGNTATDKGGGIYLTDKVLGRDASAVTFNGTKVSGNAAADASSDGIWSGASTKLSFENAQISNNVYFAGDTAAAGFLVSGTTYFGKETAGNSAKNAVELADILSGDYGALLTLATASQKITVADNVSGDIGAYGVAAFIVTPAAENAQVLVQADGGTQLEPVYSRFRINNVAGADRVPSLRSIDSSGKVIKSGEVHVKSDGNDLCDGLSEGSAFKSFEYAVFTANQFENPKVTVVDMLNDANHYAGTPIGWAAPDADSVFSIGVLYNPAEINPPSVIIEGKDVTSSGFTADGDKRALFIGADSDVTLKDLKFAGSVNNTTMTHDMGSAVFVDSDAKLTLDAAVNGGALGVLNDGTLNVAALGTAAFGKILIDDGSAIIEGAIVGSGNTEISDNGSLTVKGAGCFTSSGKILLADGKKINIDGTLTNASTTGISPYQWTIGYAVLGGNVTAPNSAKFAMNLIAPRDKWKIADDGKLAHSIATETALSASTSTPLATLTEWNTAGQPKASASFYLGADYVTVSGVDLISSGTYRAEYIYASPSTVGEKILRDDLYSGVSLSLDTAVPTANADKGGLYSGGKRAIGALYKRTAGEYLLKLDLIGNATLPTYTRYASLNDRKTGYNTYKKSAETDGYYYVDIAGAKGGDGGYSQMNFDRSGGQNGRSGSKNLRGNNGIKYGTGAMGENGIDRPTYPGVWGGGGGGGGGGDSWVGGAAGYYIATGGSGGHGGTGDNGGGYGGGGGGGGGGNQGGSGGSNGHKNDPRDGSAGGGGGGAGGNGADGGTSNTRADGTGYGGGAGGGAGANSIFAGSGGGGGGGYGGDHGGRGGSGGSAYTTSGGSLTGAYGAGAQGGGAGLVGRGGGQGGSQAVTTLGRITTFLPGTSGNTGAGYITVTEVVTVSR